MCSVEQSAKKKIANLEKKMERIEFLGGKGGEQI